MTGTMVFDSMTNEYSDKLKVCKQTVVNYVTKTKRELCKILYVTAILGYHPYRQAQVDFGEVYAFNEQGVMSKHHELTASYPASNARYIQICKTKMLSVY